MSATPFSAIVVPLDFTPESERAVTTANTLAIIAGLPLTLLTVSAENRQVRDKMSLRHTATRLGLSRWESVALHDVEPAKAICNYVADHDRALLVMASDVHGALAELASRSTVARVLRELASPVLVVGPHVDPDWKPTAPRLIACADPQWDADAALQTIVRWQRTFDSPAPWVVQVIDLDHRTPTEAPEDRLLLSFADRLAQSGVRAESEVLDDSRPVDALLHFVDSVADGVPTVTTERWADPAHVHAHSVARRLAHRCRRPVLVIPHVSLTVASGSPASLVPSATS